MFCSVSHFEVCFFRLRVRELDLMVSCSGIYIPLISPRMLLRRLDAEGRSTVTVLAGPAFEKM